MNAARAVQQYVDDVQSGAIVAGRLQRAAVDRYVSDRKRAGEADCPFVFSQQSAERAVRLIELLCFTKDEWAGKPYKLEPWQLFIVWNIFGFLTRGTHNRRFHFVWIEIARKNGKTEFAAAIQVLLFWFDGVQVPEVYSAAPKRDQAAVVFEKVVFMRSQRPYLEQRAKYLESKSKLIRPDGGVMMPLAADGRVADGFNPNGVFVDELHEWKSRKHRSLWGKLTSGSGARANWMLMVITTAGDDQSELWKRERKYSARIALQEIEDDSHFSFICCCDDDDDILDPANWPKANPNLGVSCRLDYLQTLARKAAELPEAYRDFKRYHANQIVASVNRGISDEIWQRGSVPIPVLSGRECYGGIDIGFRDDLAAFALSFPPRRPRERWAWKVWCFCPEQSKRDLSLLPYREWIRDGRLIVTPGNTTDAEAIYQAVEEARSLYRIKSIALDPNNARILGTELVTRGLKVYEFQQWSRNWNEPFRETLKLLSDGKIAHGDDPILSWCVRHLMTHETAGLMRPAKEHSTEKIDPMVAVLMAQAEALFYRMRNPKDTGDGPRIRII